MLRPAPPILGLAFVAALVPRALATEGRIELDASDLRSLRVATSSTAWPVFDVAPIASASSSPFEVSGRRGVGPHASVVAALATLRSFDESAGLRVQAVLRVFSIRPETTHLVREYALGELAPHVRIAGIAELDGDDGAEVVLVFGQGGGAGSTLEVFEPFAFSTRPGCTVHSDGDHELADVNGDQLLELLVTTTIVASASPRCSAERVFSEVALAYRDGLLVEVVDGAREFYGKRLAQAEAALAAAAAQRADYLPDALAQKVAALRAAASR